jgi:hypothetical protein
MRMPERPRRPRTPTIVVRTRGPSKSQKFLVFLAMLIVFVGGGIAFLIFYPGLGLNIIPGSSTPAPSAKPSATLSAAPTIATTTPPATTTTTTPAPPTTPSASASAKKFPGLKPPRMN